MSDRTNATESYDAIIVGAGFAGLYALHRLQGLGLSAVVLEQGDGIGGTWFWNRYPGARCDVESLQYSYSFSEEFQQEWKWSERFASQGEILHYINVAADRFGLREHIRLNVRATAAAFSDDQDIWIIGTENGSKLRSKFLIFATGCLSVPIDPNIAGLEKFEGKIYRTSKWPKEPVDFSGQRIAVVGTGSSGIQAIPVLAQEAEHLYVLQRTPNYVVPGRNSPMDAEYERDWKAHYREHRLAALETRSNNLFGAGTSPGSELSAEEREREFESRWQAGGLGFSYAFPDLTTHPEVNKQASEFVRRKIAEKVPDPQVAGSLAPTEYGIGGRRLCVDNGYYETFNRDNVTLVDLRRDPLVSMTSRGFRTERADFGIDALVLATGFDALTGALMKVAIHGRDGRSLRDKWKDNPSNYLGLAVAGFPNMFVITGPGSPSVLSNMVISIEQHVDWIAECLDYLRKHGRNRIEVKQESEDNWGRHISEISEGSLIKKTRSWYTGANVEGKPRSVFIYMGGAKRYKEELETAGSSTGYQGFQLA